VQPGLESRKSNETYAFNILSIAKVKAPVCAFVTPKTWRTSQMPDVEATTPQNAPKPIGPYSHIARVGAYITIGAVAGVDPTTGELVASDVAAQTRQILTNMSALLASVNSDLQHIIHVNVFLLRMKDFDELNREYAKCMGSHRPARTVIGVHELPKPGALLTMDLTAATRE
jgi:2-iminobutanoate/2-iminopropanoate deaminase